MFLEEKAKFGKLMELLGENGLGLISQIVVHRIVGGGIAANASPEASFAIAFVPGPEIAGTGRQFWFGGMSAGTWRVLELLTYLVFDDSSCMLLEQPEDSIHPGLLEKVVGILNRYASHTQVICTSHSPKVMNAIGPKGIRFVTAKSGTTIVRELSDNQMQAADTYLADSGMLSDFLELIRED